MSVSECVYVSLCVWTVFICLSFRCCTSSFLPISAHFHISRLISHHTFFFFQIQTSWKYPSVLASMEFSFFLPLCPNIPSPLPVPTHTHKYIHTQTHTHTYLILKSYAAHIFSKIQPRSLITNHRGHSKVICYIQNSLYLLRRLQQIFFRLLRYNQRVLSLSLSHTHTHTHTHERGRAHVRARIRRRW